MSAPAASALPRGVVAAGLYGALALASFWPQLARPWDSVAYVGDGVESVYLVAWNVRQFFRDPLRLFDANVFHPSPGALAFTDHRLLPSLLVAPAVWATGNPVLATNVAILLGSLLAAGAARRLALALGTSETAAFAAGSLYAFHTYQVSEVARLNILFHGFLPLALLALVRYLGTGERSQAWRLAGFMLAQGLSSNYHLLYGALLIALVAAFALALAPRQAARRLPGLAAPALAAALLFLPVAWPYLQAAAEHGYQRPLPLSMGLEHFWTTTPANLLYGAMGADVRTQQRGPHFTGFLPLALALVALLACASRRDRGAAEGGLLPARLWVPLAGSLALLFLGFALGRNVVLNGQYLAPGPYQLLYRFVPGFQQVRIPERLSLLAMLFLALLAARGLTLLGRRWPRPAILALAALLPLEHLAPQPSAERLPVGRDVPEVYRYLARSEARAVAELPIHGEGLIREETLEMYFSTFHWKPIVHGYTAYPPLLTRLLRRAAAQFPAEVSLQALQRVGVDTVIVHHGREVGADLRRQVTGRGEEREARFRRLLSLAGLDLYGQLGPARLEGRITRLAVFDGARARLFRSERDEVYRIETAAARPGAPFPGGRPLTGWRPRAAAGEPGLAADGDLATAWVQVEPLAGDESFEAAFATPARVGGVVVPLRWDTPFPTRFRLDGRPPGGDWQPLARYDEAHVLQLLDRVIADPASAAIGFELGDRELIALRLAVEAGGTSFDGWAIPELQILEPERR